MFGAARMSNLYAGGGGAGGGSIKTFSFVGDAYNTSPTATVVIPSSAAVGDYAFFFDRINAADSSVAQPTGFTVISDQTGTSSEWVVSYKKLVSGDPGATITGQSSGSQANRKILLVYRPSWTTASQTVSTVNESFTNSGTTLSNQTLSMSSGSGPMLGFALYAFTSTGTLTRGSTLTTDGQGSVVEYTNGSLSFVKAFVWDEGDTLSNSTISISSSTSQAIALVSFYMTFT